MKVPTEKQFGLLRILGNGSILALPGRRESTPLLRRGWVEQWKPDDKDEGKYLPPLRITPDGLRALADGLERYGWPSLDPEKVAEARKRPDKDKQERQDLRDKLRAAESRERRLRGAVEHLRAHVESVS